MVKYGMGSKARRNSVSKGRKSLSDPLLKDKTPKVAIKVASWNYAEILADRCKISLSVRALSLAKANARFSRIGAPYLMDTNSYLAEDIKALHNVTDQETITALTNSCTPLCFF